MSTASASPQTDLAAQIRALRGDVQALTRAIETLVGATEANHGTLTAILSAVTAEPPSDDPLVAGLQALTVAVEAQQVPLQNTAASLESLRTELPAAVQRVGALAAEKVIAAALAEVDDPG